MNKVKILLGPSTFGAEDKTPIEKLNNAGFEAIDNPYKRKLEKAELMELLNGVSGLIAGLETLDGEVMSKSGLKVISRCGSGMSNVDLQAAKELGVKVYSTPDAPTIAVAELTVGSMLCLLRSIPQMNEELHDGNWTKKIGRQLSGKTVLIIGFGRIGRHVAKLLQAFGAELLVVDPMIDRDDAKQRNISLTNLEEALPLAEIITLHVSGADEILGQSEFNKMKSGVYILNGARGSVVNESALIDAIENKKVAGAWLDTFTEEPYSGPLSNYDQIIMTPHVGSYSKECRLQMEMEAVDNLIAGFQEVYDDRKA